MKLPLNYLLPLLWLVALAAALGEQPAQKDQKKVHTQQIRIAGKIADKRSG